MLINVTVFTFVNSVTFICKSQNSSVNCVTYLNQEKHCESLYIYLRICCKAKALSLVRRFGQKRLLND